MDFHFLRRITARAMLWGAIALAYWLLVFITITVFDLRVFRERLTELFGFSILGILALITAAFLFNIVANFTIIADTVSSGSKPAEKMPRRFTFAFALSLPVITGLLFAGDALSAARKESVLRRNAADLLARYPEEVAQITRYRYDRETMAGIAGTIDTIARVDAEFPEIGVVYQVRIDGREFLLCADRFSAWGDKPPAERSLICRTDTEERKLLTAAFARPDAQPWYVRKKNNFRLFYPVSSGQFRAVIVLSDELRYGKVGSG